MLMDSSQTGLHTLSSCLLPAFLSNPISSHLIIIQEDSFGKADCDHFPSQKVEGSDTFL